MADELADIYGLSVRPIETGWGQAANTLAQSMPALQNPYASPGQNLAASAGAALLAGLLGFQARQQAQRETAALSGPLQQLLSAQSAKEMGAIAGQENFPERLSPLARSLALKQQQRELETGQNIAEREAYFKGLRGLEQYKFDLENSPALMAARQQEEAIKQAQFNEQKQRDTYKLRSDASKELMSGEGYKNYAKLAPFYNQAKAFVDDPNPITASRMVKLLEKSTDAMSTVTLPETQVTENTQNMLQKLQGQIRKQFKGESALPRSLIEQAYGAIQIAYDAAGRGYNEEVRQKFAQAKPFGIAAQINEIAPRPLYAEPDRVRKLNSVLDKANQLKQSGVLSPEQLTKLQEQIMEGVHDTYGSYDMRGR